MTVAQLIKVLEQMPQDNQVHYDDSVYGFSVVVSVKSAELYTTKFGKSIYDLEDTHKPESAVVLR